MKKRVVAPVAVMIMCCFGSAAFAEKAAPKNPGEENFKKLCAVCHPDGGNIVNPKKTLRKADREANNIKTEADIVNQMRNPGPGMTAFTKKAVSDKEANEIARYILQTFQ